MVKVGFALIVLTGALTFACGDDNGSDADESGVGGTGGGTGGTGGGSGGTGGGKSASIEIEGTWVSDFGSTEIVDSHSWSVDYGMGATVSEIIEYSNADNDAILLSPDDAEFDPGTYGRTVWTELADDAFYYCAVSFGQGTADDARSESEAFDDSDPENAGCGAGDFSWTKLTRE